MWSSTDIPETKGFTLEQVSALFGDEVVDMHGEVEKSTDFLKERHDMDKRVEVTWDEGSGMSAAKTLNGLV